MTNTSLKVEFITHTAHANKIGKAIGRKGKALLCTYTLQTGEPRQAWIQGNRVVKLHGDIDTLPRWKSQTCPGTKFAEELPYVRNQEACDRCGNVHKVASANRTRTATAQEQADQDAYDIAYKATQVEWRGGKAYEDLVWPERVTYVHADGLVHFTVKTGYASLKLADVLVVAKPAKAKPAKAKPALDIPVVEETTEEIVKAERKPKPGAWKKSPTVKAPVLKKPAKKAKAVKAPVLKKPAKKAKAKAKKAKPAPAPKHENREAWLQAAVAELAPLFQAIGAAPIPAKLNVSCSWPGGGSARTRIGECWPPSFSDSKTTEIFISPATADPVEALDTLAHELVHAIDGCENGHGPEFKKIAVALGLEGKMTATVAGPALKLQLEAIAKKLGAYPHSKLNLAGRKKQTTRMVKVSCKKDGYTVRTTQKWIDVAIPCCPICEEEMVVEVKS